MHRAGIDGILWESLATELGHISEEVRLGICNTKGQCPLLIRCFYTSILPYDLLFRNLSGTTILPNTKRSHSVNCVVLPERDRDSLEEQSPKSQSEHWSVPTSEKDVTFLVSLV